MENLIDFLNQHPQFDPLVVLVTFFLISAIVITAIYLAINISLTVYYAITGVVGKCKPKKKQKEIYYIRRLM